MGKTYMGFEGVAYYGVAGSTASTLIENATDISFNNENEEGSTAKRGDSSAADQHGARHGPFTANPNHHAQQSGGQRARSALRRRDGRHAGGHSAQGSHLG